MPTAPTILWFRQDLRLDDNPALVAAAKHGPVIPLFVWPDEEAGNWSPGQVSRWWLAKSLNSLDSQLRMLGSRLVIRPGRSHAVLLEIAAATGAKRIFFNRLHEPAAVQHDQRLEYSLAADGIEFEGYSSALLFDPATVLNQEGNPYRVFTSFWNRCLQLPHPDSPLATPSVLIAPNVWPESLSPAAFSPDPQESLPSLLEMEWQPGEVSAIKRLEHFLHAPLRNYIADRDRPALDGTSRLSPYLHHGEISPRRIWKSVRGQMQRRDGERTKDWLQAAEAFLRQIIWREFAYYILYHFPNTPEQPSHSEFAGFPWRKDERSLQAWKDGCTGYPLVDAGMRQLRDTGWMHNRVRMIVASFLTKHLLLSWQSGAQWFWERLVDADLANNTFGWQWAAGCGHDAAPYFRIFNPVIQGQKFDSEGSYTRRWVPELAKLPAKWIHQPWAAPTVVLEAAGVMLGREYPAPIVDHAYARARALSALTYVREKKLARRVE